MTPEERDILRQAAADARRAAERAEQTHDTVENLNNWLFKPPIENHPNRAKQLDKMMEIRRMRKAAIAALSWFVAGVSAVSSAVWAVWGFISKLSGRGDS